MKCTEYSFIVSNKSPFLSRPFWAPCTIKLYASSDDNPNWSINIFAERVDSLTSNSNVSLNNIALSVAICNSSPASLVLFFTIAIELATSSILSPKLLTYTFSIASFNESNSSSAAPVLVIKILNALSKSLDNFTAYVAPATPAAPKAKAPTFTLLATSSTLPLKSSNSFLALFTSSACFFWASSACFNASFSDSKASFCSWILLLSFSDSSLATPLLSPNSLRFLVATCKALFIFFNSFSVFIISLWNSLYCSSAISPLSNWAWTCASAAFNASNFSDVELIESANKFCFWTNNSVLVGSNFNSFSTCLNSTCKDLLVLLTELKLFSKGSVLPPISIVIPFKFLAIYYSSFLPKFSLSLCLSGLVWEILHALSKYSWPFSVLLHE